MEKDHSFVLANQPLLEKLSPRDRTILKMRLGLEDGKKWTLKEIGDKFKVSRERIRQVENLAIDQLREMVD